MTDQPSAEELIALAKVWREEFRHAPGFEYNPGYRYQNAEKAFFDALNAYTTQAVAASRQPMWLSDDDVLAGAKFYSRAYIWRAVHGIIPSNWDNRIDEDAWASTPLDRREQMIEMVRGIIVACEFKKRQAAAADRAIAILDTASERTKPDAGLPPLPKIMDTLPNCMTPDGAEPCIGYQRARDVVEIYRDEIRALRSERGAALAEARQAERERCALIADGYEREYGKYNRFRPQELDIGSEQAAQAIADAIRALTPEVEGRS